jgi:chemotaxis protein CheC
MRGDGRTLFNVEQSTLEDNLVLFLYIDFAIKSRDIQGFIALLMDLPAIAALKAIVNDFVQGVQNPAGSSR